MKIRRVVSSVIRHAAVAFLLIAGHSASGLAGTINDIGGFAIRGYDPVAYFTDHRAALGSSSFTAQYEGATFRFTSAEHRDAFVANPAKYVPQYGGFCALGTAVGHKAVTDPEAFTIVNGKLYLNYNRSVQAKWAQNVSGNISKADENWSSVSRSTEVHQ